MNFDNQPKGFEDPNFDKSIQNLDEVPQRRPNEFSFGEKGQIKRSQFNEAHSQQVQRTRPFVVENIDILNRLESLEGQVTRYKTKFRDLKSTIEHKESDLQNQRISSVEKTKQWIEARLLQDAKSKAHRNKKFQSVDLNGPLDGFSITTPPPNPKQNLDDADGSIEESIQKRKGNQLARKQAAIDKIRRQEFKGPGLKAGLVEKIPEGSRDGGTEPSPKKGEDGCEEEDRERTSGENEGVAAKEEWETELGSRE